MKLRAVVFDWAGTLADYGSRAPAAAFVELFRSEDLPLTEAQARGPMGTAKRDHVAALVALPEVASALAKRLGRAPGEAEVDALYRKFIPLQLEVLQRHGALIPGAAEVVRALRARGIKVGTTTGYDRQMLGVVLAEAEKRGLVPDCAICASDVTQGRPAPYMAWRAAESLGVYPAAAVAKVGDTPADMAEARNAGMWAVGCTRSGNELGLSESAAAALPAHEMRARLAAADDRLRAAGAHHVIESVAELGPVLEKIDADLSAGRRP
jgi:phosphonoacetaldehyde hydrolase